MNESVFDKEIHFFSKLSDGFRFACHACGRCCGAFTIILSPYDIFRLTKATNQFTHELISDGTVEIRHESFKRVFGFGPLADFLDVFGISSDDTVPVAVLHFDSAPGGQECRFLGQPADGKRLCNVYEHRPTMCRLHPLGCVTIEGEYRWFFRKPFCEAEHEAEQTVEQWLDSSGAAPFCDANAEYRHWLYSLLNGPTRFTLLPQNQREMVTRILYDFDSLAPNAKHIEWEDIGKMFVHCRTELIEKRK
jgi:Fe-S-cluster containining protein